MKTIILLLLGLSSLSLFADCSIYSPQKVSGDLKQILKNKGFLLSDNTEATYALAVTQTELSDIMVSRSGNGELILRKFGTMTVIDVTRETLFFHQSYGDALNIFATEYYQPTALNKTRSHRRALLALNRDLPLCRE